MYMICDNLYTEIGYTLSKESYLVISVSDSEEFISFVTFINIDPIYVVHITLMIIYMCNLFYNPKND